MTLDEFKQKNLGKKLDYDGAFGGQCVDLFRFYVKDVLGFPQPVPVEGARHFWSNYDNDSALNQYYTKHTNTPTAVPQKGDVVIWNSKVGNGYGHIAIFLEGNVNDFVSLDQNWPTLDEVTQTKHDYSHVYGWLRPKELQQPETPLKDTEIDWADFEGNSHTVGWYVYEWGLEKQRSDKLAEEVAKKNEDYERLQKTLAELNQVNSSLMKDKESLKNEINRLESKIDPLEAKLIETTESLTKVSDSLKISEGRVESLTKENTELRVEVKDKLKNVGWFTFIWAKIRG